MADKEVDNLLNFISKALTDLTEGEEKKRAVNLAGEWGLSPVNITHYKGYGPGSKPDFRTTYKVLKGILGRAPIRVLPCLQENECAMVSKLQNTEDWEIVRKFLEIFLHKNLLRRRVYFTILSQHISAIYEELEVLKEKEVNSA